MKTLIQHISETLNCSRSEHINEWQINNDSINDIEPGSVERILRTQFSIFKQHEKEIINNVLKSAKLTAQDILNEMEDTFDSIDDQWLAYDLGETENYIKFEFTLVDYLRKNAKKLNIPLLKSIPGRNKIVNFDKILRYIFNNVVEIMHNVE